MQRRCANCGGHVTHNTNTAEVLTASGDTIRVRGLGHWHCANGCPKRTTTTTRFIGAGHEANRDYSNKLGATEYGWRTEYMRSIPVTRDICVITRP